MNLHYSQTIVVVHTQCQKFYYLMNLHYSQTDNPNLSVGEKVLLPYEFTLLSNGAGIGAVIGLCFTTLWIYTTLKPP